MAGTAPRPDARNRFPLRPWSFVMWCIEPGQKQIFSKLHTRGRGRETSGVPSLPARKNNSRCAKTLPCDTKSLLDLFNTTGGTIACQEDHCTCSHASHNIFECKFSLHYSRMLQLPPDPPNFRVGDLLIIQIISMSHFRIPAAACLPSSELIEHGLA